MKTLWFGVVCVQVPVQIVRRKAFTIGSLPSCEIAYNLGDFAGCEYLDLDEVNPSVISPVKTHMIGPEGSSFEFEAS
uniref:Uncharacterized protein n=1 Tax=Physcomitrium patens TaxID=3218 RepID=A0A7I4CBU8_PHYPA